MRLMVSVTGLDLAEALRALVLGRVGRHSGDADAENASPGFAEDMRTSTRREGADRGEGDAAGAVRTGEIR